MGRLRPELLDRFETYADRVLDVAEAPAKRRGLRRVVDRIAGSGTSAGASLYEPDQAMTRKDFVKTVGIPVKELSESKFWLRIVIRRKWISASRLSGLLDETDQLMGISNSMIVRTRRAVARRLRP